MVTRGKNEYEAVKEIDGKKSRAEFCEYAVRLFELFSTLPEPALIRTYIFLSFSTHSKGYYQYYQPRKDYTDCCHNRRRVHRERRRKKMCLVFVCGDDERVVSRQPAPGACPYCGGMIQALDVRRQWTFCFVPLYVKTKRRHCCTVCARKLVIKK